MADELDTEPTSSTPDPAESPRAPYLAVLRRHRDAGTLTEAEYDGRVADVADAATFGDLETALADLDRAELPVATKRRQRRELPVEATATPVVPAADDEHDPDDELAADDELTADEDESAADDDEVAADEDELAAAEDDADAEDDELAALDDDRADDDPADDDPADDDGDDTDLVEDAADSDDDDDRELVTAGAASPRTSGSGGSVAKRSRSDRAPATQGKGRPTRTRKEATSTTPERTGPITFIKESVGELRKVVYPSGQQLRNYFVVVLVFVVFIIFVTSGLDLAFGQLVLQVFGR